MDEIKKHKETTIKQILQSPISTPFTGINMEAKLLPTNEYVEYILRMHY